MAENEIHPIQDWEKGMGACFSHALSQAGITFEGNIGEWLSMDDVKAICKQVGIDCYDSERMQGGKLSIEQNESVIAMYKTREGRAHAEFVTDLGNLVNQGVNFIGVIKLTQEQS